MHDHRPGHLIDLRAEQMRSQAARGHLGDFELAAARVVARSTWHRVYLQDDNSAPSMVDLRIEADRTDGGIVGYVEVVTDIDQPYAELVSAVRKADTVAAPTLGRVWWVTVGPRANLRALSPTLPSALRQLQQAGEVFEVNLRFEQQLDCHPHSVVRDLEARGVVRLASRPIRANEDGSIIFYAEGIGGPVGMDWTAFDIWLHAFLVGEEQADVRRKLGTVGAAERHVFVGASFSSPWPVLHALSDDYRELPARPPQLPREMTHVWVWFYPIGRCIAWAPSRGWYDPSTCWATD